jgi:uncharacterized membrane protein YphA (DoxX/SURF4 family)
MTTEESAIQIDWRSSFQESNALTDQKTSSAASPASATADDVQPETSVMQLSAVLIVILGGMATTFALAAIIVFLVARG